MTDNQNKNKTTMKDVQLQHFLFKTTSRMPQMFPKTLFFFVFVSSSFFLMDKSRGKTFGKYPYFLPATTTTGRNWVSYNTFLFPFAISKLI